MIDPGLGNIEAFVASELGAEAKIYILIIQEEILIEETDVLKHRTPVNSRSGTGSKDIFSFGKFGAIQLIHPSLAANAVVVKNIACCINYSRVISTKHFGSTEAHLRVGF